MENFGMRNHALHIPGYWILEKIGDSSTGSVFKARQISTDRDAAIKVLPHHFSEKQENITRSHPQGRTAIYLNHPNIVKVIDICNAVDGNENITNVFCFVMEYLKGQTVQDLLAAGKVYPEQQALEIIIPITDALDHIHANHLIHQNINPRNIMITPDGTVKLGDVGLVHEARDIIIAEEWLLYKPEYLSPEQIRGDLDIDFRCDIYSLGATFYHMITGKPPFEAPTASAIMKMHLNEKLVPPKRINQRISSKISKIVQKMMAKDREKRYPTVGKLLEELRP